MANKPQFRRRLSLMLSDVFETLGINRELIDRKHELAKNIELLYNSENMGEKFNYTVHFIYGLSDGTINTDGINRKKCSEKIMFVEHTMIYNLVQDLTDWKPGVHTLLMIQDNHTSPGHCRLQLIDSNARGPATIVPNEQYVMDDKGRVLFQINQEDEVLHCKQWPSQAGHWFNRKRKYEWPDTELKSKCMSTGIFLESCNKFPFSTDDTEWELLFSRAEMCLMYSLNATQIRCYTLVKILLKSHIHQGLQVHFLLSSYMCKTVLFYCIEENALDVWQEHQLIYCLTLVLQKLHTCVLQENCPHYFIPEKNLFGHGRMNWSEKQQLLENIQYVINDVDTVLLDLKYRCIGVELQQKLAMEPEGSDGDDEKVKDIESEGLIYDSDKDSVKEFRSMDNSFRANIVRRFQKLLGWCAVVYGWINDV